MKEFTQNNFQSLMDSLSDEQKEKISRLSDDQAMQLLDTLRQEQSRKTEVYGNVDLLIEDLKKKHVKVEENVEMKGYEGKILHIDLPAKGDFRGLKFGFFVSESINVGIFMASEGSLYSMKEISRLFGAINSYMKASGVNIDGDIDYEKDLKYREGKNNKGCSEAGKIFKEITGLEDSYYLEDRDDENNTIVFNCSGDDCGFFRDGKDGTFPSALLYKQSN